jgi:hypothetical protein
VHHGSRSPKRNPESEVREWNCAMNKERRIRIENNGPRKVNDGDHGKRIQIWERGDVKEETCRKMEKLFNCNVTVGFQLYVRLYFLKAD